jgi:hypothetical protein
MIVAVKDHLLIEVKVLDEKVNITLPEMVDVIWLWNDWIRQEENLAESFLESHDKENYYPELANYLRNNGWEIEEMRFSQS